MKKRKPKIGFMTLCAPCHTELIDDLGRSFPTTGEAEMFARKLTEIGCEVIHVNEKGIVSGDIAGVQDPKFNRDGVVDTYEKTMKAVDKFYKEDVDCVILYFTTWFWVGQHIQGLMKLNKPIILTTGPGLEGCRGIGPWGMRGSLEELSIESKVVYGDFLSDKELHRKAMNYIRASMVKNILSKSRYGSFGLEALDTFPGLPNASDWLKKFGIWIEFIDQYQLVVESEKADMKEVNKVYNYIKSKVKIPPMDATIEKQVRMYIAKKKLIERFNLDFMGIKCAFELSDNYCSPCVSQCMLAEEGFVTTCTADAKAALTMYIMRILQDNIMGQFDCTQVLKKEKIVRFHSCGAAPLSLAKSLDDIAFVQKPAIEGEALGVSLNITAKPGLVTFSRISKAGDEYVMLISRGEMFEDTFENRKNTGWPTWPYAAAKLEGDIDKFMENLRSQYMHFCYKDIVDELIDTCNLLGIRPIVCV